MMIAAIMRLILCPAVAGLCLVRAAAPTSPLPARVRHELRNLGALLFVPVVAVALCIVATCDLLSCSVMRLWKRSRREQNASALLRIETIDPDEADWADLRQRLIDGVPFILRHADGRPVAGMGMCPPVQSREFVRGAIRVIFCSWLGPLPGIDLIRRRLLPYSWRAYWPLWFIGDYDQGQAHVDLIPATVNLYYLRKGTKEVVIVPPHVSHTLSLARGVDSTYIPGTAGNYGYLRGLSSYYKFRLRPQSILCFNNSACLHHFRNVTDDAPPGRRVEGARRRRRVDAGRGLEGPAGELPEALSTRVKFSACADLRGIVNVATNYQVWWRVANIFIDQVCLPCGPEERAQEYC